MGAFLPVVQCVSPCPYMGAFLQSVPMPIYGGLFASAKCPHAHIWGPFCRCNVCPCPYMGAFLPVQSVPMPIYASGAFLPVQSVPLPIYGGLFASAKCPLAHIWAAGAVLNGSMYQPEAANSGTPSAMVLALDICMWGPECCHPLSITQVLLNHATPRYRKQMREHNSAQAGKESGYMTNAKKEEIFSDMS